MKKDQEIMKILKISELRHVVAHTNLGELCICARKDDNKYFVTLDAVELGEEKSQKILKLFTKDAERTKTK